MITNPCLSNTGRDVRLAKVVSAGRPRCRARATTDARSADATPCQAEIGIHEQHVDIAVVIQVGEPGHVAIDDGQLGVRCFPGRGPRVEVPIVGRPRLDLLRRLVGPSRLANGSEEDHQRGLGVAGRVRP